MINVDMRLDNRKGIRNIIDRITGVQDKAVGFIMQYGTTLKTNIEQHLTRNVGEKAKHFTVVLNVSATGFSIRIKAVDDVGKYLYYGTVSHTISSSGTRPMPVGDGAFAYTVHHPGTKSISEQVNKAVKDAMYETRGVMGNFGGRLI